MYWIGARSASKADHLSALLMNRVRVLNKLRIAISIIAFVACVLLCGLWLRSFWYRDQLFRSSATGYVGCTIDYGQLELFSTNDSPPAELKSGWHWKALRHSGPPSLRTFVSPRSNKFGFYNELVVIPFWFPVFFTGAMVAANWIRLSRRFSLRALLIVMTLIAVMLGLIVWSKP